MTVRRYTQSAVSTPSLRSALAALVLVGYLLVIGGSSVGHGWKMLTHLATQHHGVTSDLVQNAHVHPSPSEPETANRRSGTAPHQHHGRTHTHESTSDEGSDAPALLRIALDKHCLPTGSVLSPPPSRIDDGSPPVATWCHTPLNVETPPPRWG